LFAVPADRLVAERLTAQIDPMCLECVENALHVTHDEVRRALWPLSDRALVRVRPGRCRTCGRRRVVVHSIRSRSAPASRATPAPEPTPAETREASLQRVLVCLTDAAGDARCPA